MGYRPKTREYRLSFEGDEYDGLEVHCKSLTVDAFERMTELAQRAAKAVKDGVSSTDATESSKELMTQFSDALVKWNVETEDGIPVPATRAGVGIQQLDFILMLINVWMEAIAGVSGPLKKSSSSTETSLEQSLTMVPLSQSHQS